MITEVTKATDETGGGWVLYDAQCRFCVGLARRAERPLARRKFRLAPLQTDGARAGLGNGEELLREMRVVTAQGRVFGGAAAVVELARHFWWAAWLQGVAKLPLGKRALDAAYRWIAARRYCLGGACALAHGVPALALAGSATECTLAGSGRTRNRPKRFKKRRGHGEAQVKVGRAVLSAPRTMPSVSPVHGAVRTPRPTLKKGGYVFSETALKQTLDGRALA